MQALAAHGSPDGLKDAALAEGAAPDLLSFRRQIDLGRTDLLQPDRHRR
jgi:hypothetical protein